MANKLNIMTPSELEDWHDLHDGELYNTIVKQINEAMIIGYEKLTNGLALELPITSGSVFYSTMIHQLTEAGYIVSHPKFQINLYVRMGDKNELKAGDWSGHHFID